MKISILSLTLIFIALSTIMQANNSNQSHVASFLTHFNEIEGWFDKNFVGILLKLDEFQKNKNIQGNIAEIGVYHGKSFIPLYLMAGSDEFALAVDCFDEQKYNYDGSGAGCRYTKFLKNLERFTPNLSKYKAIKGDSSIKTAQDYIGACNGRQFRLFSIDGSHRAKETMIDLKNASEALASGGVIIVDDYFNKDWPGVSEGLTKFLNVNSNLRPFFIGFNKVLLTHKEFVSGYTTYLKSHCKPFKECEFYNSPVVIY